MTCSHCGKREYHPSRYWALHPERFLWKGANNMDYDYIVDEDGCMDICSIQRGNWRVPSNRRTCHTFDPSVRNVDRTKAVISVVLVFAVLLILQILKPILESWIFSCLTRSSIALTGALVSAERGKVTIHSGAAETVMLRNMLQHETLVEGAPKKAGVKYVAANGG